MPDCPLSVKESVNSMSERKADGEISLLPGRCKSIEEILARIDGVEGSGGALIVDLGPNVVSTLDRQVTFLQVLCLQMTFLQVTFLAVMFLRGILWPGQFLYLSY